MIAFFKRTKISHRLLLISLSFVLPIGVMLGLIVTGINDNIHFARWENYGNEYERPLIRLLETIPQHHALALRALAGDKTAADQLPAKQAEIEQAFAALDTVQAARGEALQFTEAGLAKRKREHVHPANVKKEWQALQSQVTKLSPAACADQHTHLVADLRAMISHVGEMSNLILDPDLDSYDLTDITVTALPQTQDRLATIIAYGQSLLQRQTLTNSERLQLARYAALLREADTDRVVGDAQGALEADINYYGLSTTLQTNLPLAIKEYSDAADAFINLVNQIAGADKPAVEPAAFAAAGTRAREASFKFWQTAANELDVLLQSRIHHYQRSRLQALLWSALAIGMSLLVVYSITRSINGPLRRTISFLNESADRVALTVGQLTGSSQSLAEAASEQAASLEETSASLEEISSMTRRNADNSQTAKELAGQTRAAADTAASDMDQMRAAMQDIKSSSDSIGKIVKSIDEIAFQTNILALNAAVEAARAGEAGLGFAVVADEVRNLAQRSAQAAKETAEKIEDSIKKSENGAQISVRVAGSLEQIVTKVRQVDDLVASMATASREQSQGIDQLNTAVTQMDKVTQSNAAIAEESAGAAAELNAQADALKHAVTDLSKLAGGKGQTADQSLSPVGRVSKAPEESRFATASTKRSPSVTASLKPTASSLKGEARDF